MSSYNKCVEKHILLQIDKLRMCMHTHRCNQLRLISLVRMHSSWVNREISLNEV